MPDINSLTTDFFDRREATRPTAMTWAKHIALLIIALITVTISGVLEPFGKIPIFPNVNPQTWTETWEFFTKFPVLYLQLVFSTIYLIFTDYELLKSGLSFSISLLVILTAHESGHYIACRIYGVDATLPFFIPLPPLIGPAGTLGAFIKIVSPLPSRRATFDIGVAGPIAGFVALVPILIIGLLTMQQVSPETIANNEVGLYFSDPLLTHILAKLMSIDLTGHSFNPFFAAAWIGLLVTSLNLIPSGQLDGGHAIYAVFGEKIHFWTGRIAFVVMVLFAISGWFVFNSPGSLLFAVLLGFMMRIRHPEPLDETPLDLKRIIIALITLIIFILCFVPFPIKIQ